jgi:two-component system, NarL family, response regulator LiaR
MNAIRIVLVEDHRVVSRSLCTYLESFDDVKVTGIAASGEEALKKIGEWTPDVVVMDLLMPGGIDGIETTRLIRSRFPRMRIVVLTASTDEARMIAALRAGAVGYVRKDAEPEVLLSAVRAAARGLSVIDPAVAGNALLDLVRGGSPEEELTDRELTVLRQLAHGRTNREIAEALFISEETVKTHLGNILGKLQQDNRTQALIYALKNKLISLDDLDLEKGN